MYIYRERTNERKEWTQERESNGRYHNKRADLYDKQNVISFFAFFDILISSWLVRMHASECAWFFFSLLLLLSLLTLRLLRLRVHIKSSSSSHITKCSGARNKNRNIYSFFIQIQIKCGTMKIKTDRKIAFAMNVYACIYLKINTRIIFNRCCCFCCCCVLFPSFSFSNTFYSDFLDFSHSVCLSRYKVLSHCQRKSFDFFRLLSLTCSLASTGRICLSTQLLWIVCVCENLHYS